MKKLSKHEFCALQQHWYEKLAATGFTDIEKSVGDDYVLKQPADACYHGADGLSREMKEEYFRFMGQMAEDEETFFKNEAHRHILIRHAEGAMISTIVKELESRGIRRRRLSIRMIIRRYETAWGLRSYTPNLLNIYKKKA